jgi:hypothetical protein
LDFASPYADWSKGLHLIQTLGRDKEAPAFPVLCRRLSRTVFVMVGAKVVLSFSEHLKWKHFFEHAIHSEATGILAKFL